MREREHRTADVADEQRNEQEFLAILTDCALPTDVSRVFDDYHTIGHIGACEALLVIHKALLRR